MRKVSERSKPCERCGSLMLRKRYGERLEDLTVFYKRRFCSLSCANTKKTLTKHGYSWRARKHLQLSCEACGERRQLHAHHVDQTKSNNDPSNIQTLCKWCHNFLHATAKRLGRPLAGRMVSLELRQESNIGWTDLGASETPSSLKSLKRSEE